MAVCGVCVISLCKYACMHLLSIELKNDTQESVKEFTEYEVRLKTFVSYRQKEFISKINWRMS